MEELAPERPPAESYALVSWDKPIREPQTRYRRNTRLTVEDVQYILDITVALKQSGRYGVSAYQQQQFTFDLLLFFKTWDTKDTYLPFNTRLRFGPKSKEKTASMTMFLEEKGVIVLRSAGHPSTGESNRYRLCYEHKSGREIKSFEEGLHWLFSNSTLSAMFTEAAFDRL